MEEEKVIKEGTKNSYITGIVGSLIGGAIAAIPWVFVYVKCNMILSVLAILIALGALKGYELFKGKITKSLKIIVIVVTLLIVIVANLVVIPNFIAYEDDIEVSVLYENSEFQDALIQDLIVSIIFAALGVSAAISSINNTLIKNGVIEVDNELEQKQDEFQKAQIKSRLKNKDKESYEVIRGVFEKHKAFDKENAISKETIFSEINIENKEKIFNKYNNRGVIKKYNENYFYDKSREMHLTNNYWIIFIVIIIVVAVIAAIAGIDESTDVNNSYVVEDSNSYVRLTINEENFYVEIPEDWEMLESDYVYTSDFISPDGEAEIMFITTGKDELEGEYTLEDYTEGLDEYMYSIYTPEEEGKIVETTVNLYDAYKLEFDSVYEGYKIHITAYCVETDNYFAEIYTFSARSKSQENDIIFQTILDTFEEI